MNKVCFLVCVMASLLSAPAWANEPGKSDTGLDYNYLGVDYASYTISSVSGYAGYKVNGSLLSIKISTCLLTTSMWTNRALFMKSPISDWVTECP